MRSSKKCISPSSPADHDPVDRKPAPLDTTPLDPDEIDISPDVCVFRHVALLHVPEPCRRPLRHLGNLLFDWSMETFGIADEEPDTEAITARRLQAIGEDLETAGHQLAALSLEPEGSEVGRAEQTMCDQAGRLAPSVLHLARTVRAVAG